MNKTYFINEKPPFAALFALATQVTMLGTMIEDLGDCEKTDVDGVKKCAGVLEQAARNLLINVQETVFTDAGAK